MAEPPFDSFVLLAEMRTGSNALAERLNAYDGITCHGEVFNPTFVGGQGNEEMFGIDLEARQKDPLPLLERIRNGRGVTGFRFFHNHDRRVLAALLPDRRCAKILLDRDPVEAFVSWKIAQRTGQWILTDVGDRKQVQVPFDRAEFDCIQAKHGAFRAHIMRILKETGQAPFQIDYADLGDPASLNGLARFLGVTEQRQSFNTRLRRQNPEPIEQKVSNPEDLPRIAERQASFRTQGSAGHGPAVRTWVAGARTPLLFMPLKAGPTEAVTEWLARIDDVPVSDLQYDFSRQTIRAWKNQNKLSRSFTVVSHPVDRAHRSFCRYVLATGPGTFGALRHAMRTRFNVPLPEEAPGPNWTADAHRSAFMGFLEFARANNAGETGLRSDPAWAPQLELLASISTVLPPDRIVREADLTDELTMLAARFSEPRSNAPPSAHQPYGPIALSDIYDDEVEKSVRAVHNRDYMAFGFRRWSRPHISVPRK